MPLNTAKKNIKVAVLPVHLNVITKILWVSLGDRPILNIYRFTLNVYLDNKFVMKNLTNT